MSRFAFSALLLLLGGWPRSVAGQPAAAPAQEQSAEDDPYHVGAAISRVAGGDSNDESARLWRKVDSVTDPLTVLLDPATPANERMAAMKSVAAAAKGDPNFSQVLTQTLGQIGDSDAARAGSPEEHPRNGAIPPPGEGRQRLLRHREEAAEVAVELDPRNPRLRARSGEAAYFAGDPRKALEETGQAIELGDRTSSNLTIYGRSAFELGDYRLASQAGGLAASLDASNKDAQILYGMSQGRTSKVSLPSVLSSVGLSAPGPDGGAAAPPPAAAQTAEEGGASSAGQQSVASAMQAAAALQGPSKQSDALSTESERRLGVKDYSSAMALASQAIALDARNAAAWTYRAIADSKLKFYPDAVRDASQALNLLPGNSVALQTRAWALAKQGRYQEALADANASLESDPSGMAYYNRAFALAGLGQADASMDSLQKAAQADPRIQPKLEEAINMPDKADIKLVFDDDEPAARPGPGSPASRLPRFWRLVLLSASGGLLFALGFLNVFSASWRQRVQNTVRRALGTSSAGVSDARGAPSSSINNDNDGFWGQYIRARPIGSGGMGVVYEAVDRRLERKVAIKRMREEIRADPAERRRFVTEAKTVAALHHPGIVDIYSIVEEGSEVYLVFEHVAGLTMADLLKKKGRLDFDAARRALAAVAQAVDYAHRRKVIHRDLKPSNLMVSEDGAVKVMDFGVARQAQEALTRTAHTNTVVGTPAYMAPEQEQGEVRPESDVFGLAVCFYEMLTGMLPFEGVGAGMLLNKLGGKHVPASKRADGLPAGLDQILAKALAPDPSLRYHTAGELAAAVDAAAASRT